MGRAMGRAEGWGGCGLNCGNEWERSWDRDFPWDTNKIMVKYQSNLWNKVFRKMITRVNYDWERILFMVKDIHLFYIELPISFLFGWKCTVNFLNQCLWRPFCMSRSRIIRLTLRALCCLPSEKKWKHDFYFSAQCIIKQSRIIKVLSASAFSFSW